MNEKQRIYYGKLTGYVGIATNILLATLKLLVGISSGMVSIVADAINNYSDAISSIVSLIGFTLASRPADDEHPFGHARYEYISGLVVVFLILMAGIELLKSSFDKIIHPGDVSYSVLMYAVLIFSVVAKILLSLFNRRIGTKINSNVILATSEDGRNDAITTSVVLLAAILSSRFPLHLDGYMGVAVALFISWSGINLLKDTMEPLLGSAPDPELVRRLEEEIMSYPGVLGTHDLMVHDYGPGRLFASVHVEVPAEENVLTCHELIDRIENELSDREHLHLVIHYDPIVTTDSKVSELRSFLSTEAASLHESLSIHDLRIVPGVKNTNVIFDCVVPHTCPIPEQEIIHQLKQKTKAKYPNHTAVIKIDHSFVSLNN